MQPWLAQLVDATRALSGEDLAASADLGVARSLRGGVTVVGDIAYGAHAAERAAEAGLGGVFYWEFLGIDAPELPGALSASGFPADTAAFSERIARGISPHAPYTAGPRLLRATHEVALREGCGFAVHVAESAAEVELLATGGGPLEHMARRLAIGFRTPHASPVAYLDSLGVLDGAVAVHCVHVDETDAAILAERSHGAVLCPRSNAYLHNGSPPVELLARARVPLALGTDSAASNADLDMFAEAKALREIAPGLDAERVLRMLTAEGAEILGLQRLYGTLETGKQADLVAVRVGPTDEPVEAFVSLGSASTVEAVMSAGIWRVLGEETSLPIAALESAGRAVAEKAGRALGVSW
jgi:cytosine/adenosine deaminase-related metal-dependent hydrolase